MNHILWAAAATLKYILPFLMQFNTNQRGVLHNYIHKGMLVPPPFFQKNLLFSNPPVLNSSVQAWDASLRKEIPLLLF